MGHWHTHHQGKYHMGHARKGMCPGCGEGRHFYTKEEKKAWLEDYVEQLEKELRGAKERLEEL
ncbi:MAG: hypothetical protein C4562_06120 [Actinobacteria bacterium]|nr:MAG: hypothetical protein C4562_06120 [Actinomycetota bacterium]